MLTFMRYSYYQEDKRHGEVGFHKAFNPRHSPYGQCTTTLFVQTRNCSKTLNVKLKKKKNIIGKYKTITTNRHQHFMIINSL